MREVIILDTATRTQQGSIGCRRIDEGSRVANSMGTLVPSWNRLSSTQADRFLGLEGGDGSDGNETDCTEMKMD